MRQIWRPSHSPAAEHQVGCITGRCRRSGLLQRSVLADLIGMPRSVTLLEGGIVQQARLEIISKRSEVRAGWYHDYVSVLSSFVKS
jgi:hypothetical protein